MEAVNTTDAIVYGFKHIATGILIVLSGVFFALVGVGLMLESPVAGIVLALIGFSIIAAGTAGLGYKVIADAVATGQQRVAAHGSADQQQRAEKVAKKVDN